MLVANVHCGRRLTKAIQVKVVYPDDLDDYLADLKVKGPTNFNARVMRKLSDYWKVLPDPVSTLFLETKLAKRILIRRRRSGNEI